MNLVHVPILSGSDLSLSHPLLGSCSSSTQHEENKSEIERRRRRKQKYTVRERVMGDKEGVMAVGDDMGEGMQCSDHPYGNNLGGICALCLQEKLGKLVSSSNASTSFLSLPPHPSSSPSDYGPTRTAGTVTGGPGGRSRGPFLSATATATHKKKSSGGGGVRKVTASSSSSSASTTANSVVVLKRSKSVAPRPMGGAISDAITTESPRKKSFWSFLYLSSSSSSSASTAANSSSSNKRRSTSYGPASENGSRDLKQQQQKEAADAPQSSSSKVQTKTYTNVSKEDQEAVADSPGGSQASSSSFGRKVARSRSVGCGSRSFSGDFLERISTGFGDCTLRRVESHRESNNGGKHSSKMVLHRHDSDEQRIKERVKCGGLFGGFGMISSSSSTYWLSAAAAAAAGDDDFDTTASGRIGSSTARASSAAIVRGGGGRSRTWGWAFASPMRAFRPTATTSSSTSSKSYATTTNAISSINAAAAAIGNGNGKSINGGSGSNGKVGANPSLLAVGGYPIQVKKNTVN